MRGIIIKKTSNKGGLFYYLNINPTLNLSLDSDYLSKVVSICVYYLCVSMKNLNKSIFTRITRVFLILAFFI